MLLKLLAVLVTLVLVINAERQHFHGNQVLRVQAKTNSHLEVLKNLDDEGSYDFWSDPRRLLDSYTDIMVTPENKRRLESIFQTAGMPYTVMIDDLESLLENERTRMASRQSTNMTWDEYHTLPNIYTWLDSLAASNGDILSVVTFGKSSEGRDLKILKISTGGPPKPAFWIDATIHAREWVSTATSTYIINQLVNHRSDYADILEALDFYILPVVNPDGYDFTHNTNRLWRKTRSNYGNYTGNCIGIDANRNFGYKFGIDDDGSSNNPCTETYRGPFAYSEPEADAVNKYVKNKANTTNWTAFITLHSYSQLWMSPYGYSETIVPDNYPELLRVSNECVAVLTAVNGTQYTTGNAGQILYKSNGSSRDWAAGEAGFEFVYTIELRDTGRYGFVLPPAQIIPTAYETWQGIQVLAKHIIAKNANSTINH